MPGIMTHVRRRMGRGLLLVLPALITLWLLNLLYGAIDAYITPWVMGVLRRVGATWLENWLGREVLVPLFGVLLTALFVYLIGLMAGNLAGRRILTLIEESILRIPLVKGIYGAARQLLRAIGMTSKRAFSRAVLIEYPRRGLWTVGFVTSEVEHHVAGPDSTDARVTVAVFLPTTPNPTSGWMMLVPKDDLFVLEMTIEDAVKLVVSGGIVSPDDLGPLLRTWAGKPALLPPRRGTET